ncbi:MAG: DASS family sodium-coupled anion symporter [Planctomycetes bacterium]|nr:DASS family sodium-coupled anion symporter [Planctomycetota bacterium]
MTVTTPPSSASPAVTATRRSRVLVLVASGLAAVLVYLALPHDMGELGRRCVAIALFAAVLWATEAIPLFAASLSVVGLEVLLLARRSGEGVAGGGGGLASTGDLSYTQFFEPFASSTVILFLGGFLLAAAVRKHGLDRAIASRLLRPFVGDSYQLVMAVILTTGFLSVFISNTATAAMMLAIVTPLVRDPATPRQLASAVVLAVSFGASIGGFMTPVSTPPNAITISQLQAIGVHISFVQWVLMAAPLSVGMLVITGGLLCAVLRPPPLPRSSLPPSVASLGGGGGGDGSGGAEGAPSRLSWRAWVTVVVIVGAVLAWMSGTWHGVDDAAVALIAATLLAAVGVLDRRDVRAIDWDVLLLMWGGLALGHGLHLTGVLEYVGGLPLLRDAHGWALALMVIGGGMVFATFMSNTAAATILVPLAIVLSTGGAAGAAADGADAETVGRATRLAVLAGLTVSFAVSMPISTPPNAMAYATGLVSSRDMIRVGLLVSLIAVGVLMAGYFWVLPWVLG